MSKDKKDKKKKNESPAAPDTAVSEDAKTSNQGMLSDAPAADHDAEAVNSTERDAADTAETPSEPAEPAGSDLAAPQDASAKADATGGFSANLEDHGEQARSEAPKTEDPQSPSETASGTPESASLDKMTAEHAAIRQMLGLDKPLSTRGQFEQDNAKTGIRPYIVIALTIAVIAASIAAWFGFEYIIAKQEEARFIAEHDRKLAEEQARRNRTEYADIAFLESFPPNVAIAMDGKQLYARAKDGSYTELRARESTWIQNLPIKEDTVIKFSFAAEGFHPLTRTVAYYDWYPSNKAGANPLQKVFKKIVLEPEYAPRIPQCADLPKLTKDDDPCEWSVFREIVFRERYAEAVKPLTIPEPEQRKSLAALLALHPLLAQAATGFDPQTLGTNKPIVDPELPDATKSLLKTLTEHPFGLYGAITIKTDTPDTRVFFMSEPLMVVKASGSMSQVKVQPDAPYTFAVYGQGRPLEITQPMTIRLETDNAPAYVTEIAPHMWHCTPATAEMIPQIPAPPIAPEAQSPDYRHQLCDYSITISVDFKAINEIEAEAAKQREAAKEKEKQAQPTAAN
ncbi:MAG: hypothetical protein IKY83_09595 [Proteobacteria bacterium]|nr:hypothetical protein [Pseudomonadota bacterium]